MRFALGLLTPCKSPMKLFQSTLRLALIAGILLSIRLVGRLQAESPATPSAVPDELLDIPGQVAAIPDLMMEYRSIYRAPGKTLERRRKYYKQGRCWRDEWWEGDKLYKLLSYDGVHLYIFAPHNHYLFITDDLGFSEVVKLTLGSIFRDNPLYGWAMLFHPDLVRYKIVEPEFVTKRFWMEHLRGYTVERLEAPTYSRLFRLTDTRFQQEYLFKAGDDGEWQLTQYTFRHLIQVPGATDHTVVDEISGWQTVAVGSATVRLPMRIARTIIAPGGRKQAGYSFDVVPGSVRELPKVLGIEFFRVPLNAVTRPHIRSRKWPKEEKPTGTPNR